MCDVTLVGHRRSAIATSCYSFPFLSIRLYSFSSRFYRFLARFYSCHVKAATAYIIVFSALTLKLIFEGFSLIFKYQSYFM